MHDVSLIVDLFQVPFVHFPYPFLNFNLVVPSQGVEFGRIGQFAQGAVRFACLLYTSYDKVIRPPGRDNGADNDIDISMLVGLDSRLMQQLLNDIGKL